MHSSARPHPTVITPSNTSSHIHLECLQQPGQRRIPGDKHNSKSQSVPFHVRACARAAAAGACIIIPSPGTKHCENVATRAHLMLDHEYYVCNAQLMPDRAAVGSEPRLCDAMPRALRIIPVPTQWNVYRSSLSLGRLSTPSARELSVSRRDTAHSPALRTCIPDFRENSGPEAMVYRFNFAVLGKARLKRIVMVHKVWQAHVSKQGRSTAWELLRSCYLDCATSCSRPLHSILTHGSMTRLSGAHLGYPDVLRYNTKAPSAGTKRPCHLLPPSSQLALPHHVLK